MGGYGEAIQALTPGERLFQRYTLERALGFGGMGAVWLAHDEQLARPVALKFLAEHLFHDPRALENLKRETRKCLELTHHNIVRVYDFLQDGRLACISMEYVDGPSLLDMQGERGDALFSVEELAPWIRQVVQALHYAHTTAKIVHRDIKPANVMLNARGEVKLADFGLARTVVESNSRVTMGPTKFGTLTYMSPQQMYGELPNVLDDVYSLAATMYDLLTGRPPFFTGDIYIQVAEKTLPSVARRRRELGVAGEPVPKRWEDTLAAALRKEATARPQSILEFGERLGLGKQIAAPAKAPASAPVTARVSEEVVDVLRQMARLRRVVFAGAGVIFLLVSGTLVWQSVRHHVAKLGFPSVRPGNDDPVLVPTTDSERGLVQFLDGLGTEGMGTRARPWPGGAAEQAGRAAERFAAGDYEGAGTAYAAILASNPGHPGAAANLGLVRLEQGRVEDAIELLLGAVRGDPADAFARAALGKAYLEAGRGDKAVEELASAAKLAPGDARNRLHLGLACGQRNWKAAAERSFLQALKIDPASHDASLGLARTYADSKPPVKDRVRVYYQGALNLGAPPDPRLDVFLRQ